MKSGENEVEDLFSYADIVTSAMKNYLALVPPQEVEEARKLLNGY